MKKGFFKPQNLIGLFVAAAYLFLYLPIVILIIFSFNNSLLPFIWKQFTLKWYQQLFQSPEVWNAVKNSLIVAFSAVFLSLVMGVFLVFYSSRNFLAHFLVLFYGTLAIPEIVLAASLLAIFLFAHIPLGLMTLIAVHTLLGLGYVVPMVAARFAELDYSLTEAAMDLGATRTQTFFSIILPLLSPALVASALLVFIISFDDFLLSFFCAGAGVQTLPMYIFSMIRSGATPMINALSTILLVLSTILVLLISSLKIKRMDMLP